MKKFILATAFAFVGTIAVSAQVTPQKTDTVRPDTTRTHRDMKKDDKNWDKSKSDTTKWKNKDAVEGDKKMKRKEKMN